MRNVTSGPDGALTVTHDNGFVEEFRPVGNGSPYVARFFNGILGGYIVPGWLGTTSAVAWDPATVGMVPISDAMFASMVHERRRSGRYVPTSKTDVLLFAEDFDAFPMPDGVNAGTMQVQPLDYVQTFQSTQPIPVPVVPRDLTQPAPDPTTQVVQNVVGAVVPALVPPLVSAAGNLLPTNANGATMPGPTLEVTAGGFDVVPLLVVAGAVLLLGAS